MGSATSTRLGRDVSTFIPAPAEAPGWFVLEGRDAEIWELASAHLHVRNNDSHTLYAYGLARALLSQLPGADEAVVLPAILLHDTGWSTVPEDGILEAIAPGGGRPDLVLKHEKEGARIAREVLERIGHRTDLIDRVVEIVDGHDSRRHALNLDDEIVKDADKLWRSSPHGIRTVTAWFDLAPDEAARLCIARGEPHLFTDPARAIARAFGALASIDLAPQLRGLAED